MSVEACFQGVNGGFDGVAVDLACGTAIVLSRASISSGSWIVARALTVSQHHSIYTAVHNVVVRATGRSNIDGVSPGWR